MRPHLLRTVLRHAARPEVGSPPDAELVRRFAADGDPEAFAELVRRHARLVWGVCRNLLPEEADAEDAFQATFLALVRSAGRLRDPRAVGGWLHGVAVRVCTKARRAAARRKAREKAAAVGESAAAVPDSAWEALLAAVHEEVTRLPDRERVPFVLCCLEGKGVSEAAAELGWKLGTLSGRLTRAKQALLDRLARRGIAPGVAAAAAVAGGAAPAGVCDKVLALARPGGAVPEAVLHLAKGVTDMGFLKTKLLAAGLLVAAAVGVTTWSAGVPTAGAQQPTREGPSSERRFGRGADTAGGLPAAGGPQWEYKYVNFGEADYERKANELGRDGWEMVTSVSGTNFFFKRPKAGVRPPAATTPAPTATTPAPTYFDAARGVAPGRGSDEGGVTELVPLKNASAAQMMSTLQSLFPGRVAATADSRSNTLILRGPADVLKEMKKLVEQLDALPDRGDTKPGPRR